jgi:hypothetical protein
MATPEPVTLTMPDGTVRAFPSLSEACRTFNVPLARTSKRIRHYGWSAEEAIGLAHREERVEPLSLRAADGSVTTYRSLNEACREHGVPYLLAYRRLDRGWTPEEAMGMDPAPSRSSPAAKEVVVSIGKKTHRWPSLDRAAKANGVTASAVKQRLRRGWSLAEALGLRDSGRPPHRTEVTVVDGGVERTFASRTEAAHAYALSADLVNQRVLKLGWSIEEALGITPRQGHAERSYGLIYLVTHIQSGKRYVGQTKEVTVGKRWEHHVKEATTNSRMTARPLIAAIRQHGVEAFRHEQLDVASSQAELNAKEVLWIATLNTRHPSGFNATRGGAGLESGKSVVLDGRRFKSLSAACKHFGVPLSSAARWVKKGTPEQAFGLAAKPKRRSSHGHPIEFTHGQRVYRYGSIRLAAEAHGIAEKKLQRRLKAGWTFQEALELVERPGADQERPLRMRVGGEVLSYPSHSAAARSHGLSTNTLFTRLSAGWSIERALLTPAGKQGRRRSRDKSSGD